ncbi:hypothetical protein B1B_14477 [mine drainage metagenome]|uniref:Uncharacterized protein n=1 Tax=mine drainage metagenome TaxID=410659 RepID=T0ZBY5_9ZZZZ
MTYDRYWDEIIERIRDTPWWASEQPKNAKEAAVWDGRAAMLDAIFYEVTSPTRRSTARAKTARR